ncbi:MAG: hypothetical protein V9H25_08625 [Candidatus Competibacter sp.]
MLVQERRQEKQQSAENEEALAGVARRQSKQLADADRQTRHQQQRGKDAEQGAGQ